MTRSVWWHLTPSGKVLAVWLRIRRVAVAPAPPDERCIMGSPVDPMVWCPRRAIDGIWCERHVAA